MAFGETIFLYKQGGFHFHVMLVFSECNLYGIIIPFHMHKTADPILLNGILQSHDPGTIAFSKCVIQ